VIDPSEEAVVIGEVVEKTRQDGQWKCRSARGIGEEHFIQGVADAMRCKGIWSVGKISATEPPPLTGLFGEVGDVGV